MSDSNAGVQKSRDEVGAPIRVIGLSKSFQEGAEKVLNNISIDFPPGKLTYILGPSGVGKSVLIKHVLGLLEPDEGEVWVDGENLAMLSHRQLVSKRLCMGMLFQNAALFDDLTVFENVAFPLFEHEPELSLEDVTKRVKTTLEKLGMSQGLEKLPNQLSGGMKKRVGLARAIIRKPSILLYDEPTTGLDPITRNTVDEMIGALKQELKLTSIVISHDISSALLLADRIAFLHGGKLAFFGAPEEFKNAKHEAIQNFLNAERRVAKVFGD